MHISLLIQMRGLEKAILWIESSILAGSNGFEVKNILMVDLFLTNSQLFSSQLINWWTGVIWITCGLLWCFYQPFGLSFWRHPFTAEDPFMSKWCNAKFLQICSDKKQTHLYLGWPEGEYIFSKFKFLLNHSFKVQMETLGNSSWTELLGKYLRTQGKQSDSNQKPSPEPWVSLSNK